MHALQREILELIHAHDGQWSWYQIDRALSHWSPQKEEHRQMAGSLMDVLRELEEHGLVTTKAGHHTSQPVYVMTTKGQQALEAHHKQSSPAT
jgi:DNA-binding PadR family transcriptional regulator